jgi:Tfp pilus assembly protein PilV
MNIRLQTNRSSSTRTRVLVKFENHPAVRNGSTLSEVLVALLIMAIGVISLASLFPISVLKTAKATQLTTAADICYNARSWCEMYPYIITDPDPNDSNRDSILFNDEGYLPASYLFDPMALAADRIVQMDRVVGVLPRFGGGFESSIASAERICAGLDSWSMVHEGTVTSIDATRTRLKVADLSGVNLIAPGVNQMRVHLTSNLGRQSQTREVTGILSGNELTWSEDADASGALNGSEDLNNNMVVDAHALPGGVTFETARIEVRERRYSWMLTITASASGDPQIKVVVYFGREFTKDDEQIFGTPPGMFQPPGLVTGSAALMQVGTRQFTVSWPGSNPAPHLKRGGWILDAQNGEWYQIENYTDTSGMTSSTITTTKVIRDSSSLVMFPRGVVEVF